MMTAKIEMPKIGPELSPQPLGSRVGAWSIMGGRVGVEAMCRLGIDFIGIDSQHGFFAFEEAAIAIQVANLCRTPCFVRVPAGQVEWVPRYLDAGADGIVLAMVENLEQVQRAVELSRYQPNGKRSYGGGKRNGVGEERSIDPRGEAPEIFAMIETADALADADQIAAVPGLAGMFVGPVDLGLAMERPYPLLSDDEPWRVALRQVMDACKKAGVRPGMFAVDGDDARDWLQFGFSDVVLSSDIAMLRRAMHEHLVLAHTPGPAGDAPQPRSADPYAGR